MAELETLMQQNRNPFVIKRFEFWVIIDVKNIDDHPEFGCQRKQRQFHRVTEMAIGPRDQRQPGQINRPFCRASP